MNSPYTLQPLDALMAAQTSVGLALTALVWARPLRPRIASVLLVGAIWVAVLSPVDVDFLRGIGLTIEGDHTERMLRLSLVLAALAGVVSGRILLAVAGLFASFAFWRLREHITQADRDMAGVCLAAIGGLIGIHYRSFDVQVDASPRRVTVRPGYLKDDIGLFVVAMASAAVVAVFVLHRHTNSGDEWANTYQAALFAKLHAYDAVPPCSEAFRSFWVFQYLGRSFAQFTPGWPLFMAPFIPLHAAWLAGPCALGVLAVGVAHVSRRAAGGFAAGTVPPSNATVRAAGILGGLVVSLGSTVLINGASRYPHVFVAAMFAWSVEALCRVADRQLPHPLQWKWGVALGSFAALMLSARPTDGATLGVGLFAYFVYAAARRRFGLRALAGAALAFAVWGGLSAVILRAQLGKWGTTGYSLTGTFYPWFDVEWSWPKWEDAPNGIPLASGSYCWWPCSPALGLAGLFALRGRARRIGVVMVLSLVPLLALYLARDGGSGGTKWSYGPRYQLVCIVPMAIGTAAILSRLWDGARARTHRRSALVEGGPFAVVLVAAMVGIVRIAPLIFPYTFSEVRIHNRLNEGLDTADLHGAIVLAHPGISNTDAKDLTENLPLDLYPDQDVLIAIDDTPLLEKCVREHFPERRLYHAYATGAGVKIEPE